MWGCTQNFFFGCWQLHSNVFQSNALRGPRSPCSIVQNLEGISFFCQNQPLQYYKPSWVWVLEWLRDLSVEAQECSCGEVPRIFPLLAGSHILTCSSATHSVVKVHARHLLQPRIWREFLFLLEPITTTQHVPESPLTNLFRNNPYEKLVQRHQNSTGSTGCLLLAFSNCFFQV